MSSEPEYWVEGHQVKEETAVEVAQWCGGKLVEEIHPVTGEKTPGINVQTLRNVKRASKGDYIVENEFGEFEVVNEATYNEHPISDKN